MTTENTTPDIDRGGWTDGPWRTEPDRVDWTHAGLPCLALRNHYGTWCGYAAVPPGHPLHGFEYSRANLDAHGGLTYSGPCSGPICHVPAPGEPDDVWWFGFDCGHAFDFAPGMDATLRRIGARSSARFPPYAHEAALAAGAAGQWLTEVYRTVDYVQAETNRLAEQLADASSEPD